MVHYLPMEWGRMAYEDTGTGTPAVLCLHGNGCDMSDWDGTITRLPSSWRKVRIDFRGHGASDVPGAPFSMGDVAQDVAALVRRLGPPAPWIVGHSLGGMVAMEAVQCGVEAAGLVLVEGWTKLSAASAFRPGRVYDGLSRERVEAIKAKGWDTFSRFEAAVWDTCWKSVGQFDGSRFLETATLPIVEIYGDAGRVARTRELLSVPERPNIHWHWIRGAGHYLPLVCPEDIAKICRETVEEGPSPRPSP